MWLQIDPEPNLHLSKIIDEEAIHLANARSKNFDAIVRNIKSLYEEELMQTVLILPDCYVLGQNPGMCARLRKECRSLIHECRFIQNPNKDWTK